MPDAKLSCQLVDGCLDSVDGFSGATATTSAPTYLKLADELEVTARNAVPGARLPSEHELCDRYGVSRLTARTALQELERRHLVRRVRGSGTYAARRIDYPVRAGMAPSWSETVRQAGAEPYQTVLGIGLVEAPPAVRAALGLAGPARVVAVTRLGHVDGLVSGVATSWLPRRVVSPGELDDVVGDGESLYAALCARGYRPRRRWSRAELDVVPLEIAPQLELEGRPAIWHTTSLNEDEATGGAVEYAEAWSRPDVFRMLFEFGAEQP
jgi:DNA-binding GntR family transcriptional regulator